MTNIHQLLEKKGRHYLSVGADKTVHHALEIMAKENVGSLLVVDGVKFSGIITERDYARDVELKGRTAKGTLVKDIMKTNVASLKSTDSVEDGLELILKKRLRYLPVVDDGHVAGVVSIADLEESCAEDQKFTIEQLQYYIIGDFGHH